MLIVQKACGAQTPPITPDDIKNAETHWKNGFGCKNTHINDCLKKRATIKKKKSPSPSCIRTWDSLKGTQAAQLNTSRIRFRGTYEKHSPRTGSVSNYGPTYLLSPSGLQAAPPARAHSSRRAQHSPMLAGKGRLCTAGSRLITYGGQRCPCRWAARRCGDTGRCQAPLGTGVAPGADGDSSRPLATPAAYQGRGSPHLHEGGFSGAGHAQH